MVNTTTLDQDHRRTNVPWSRAQIMSSLSFCTRTKLSLRLCFIYKALLSIRESFEKKRRRLCICTGHVQTINYYWGLVQHCLQRTWKHYPLLSTSFHNMQPKSSLVIVWAGYSINSSSLAAFTAQYQINKSAKFATFQNLRFETCAVICTRTIWMQRTVSSMLLPRLLARSSTSNRRWSHKKRGNASGGTLGLMRAMRPCAKNIGTEIRQKADPSRHKIRFGNPLCHRKSSGLIKS